MEGTINVRWLGCIGCIRSQWIKWLHWAAEGIVALVRYQTR